MLLLEIHVTFRFNQYQVLYKLVRRCLARIRYIRYEILDGIGRKIVHLARVQIIRNVALYNVH